MKKLSIFATMLFAMILVAGAAALTIPGKDSKFGADKFPNGNYEFIVTN